MKPFDTHAHLYDKAFDRDRDEVLTRTLEAVDYVVIPSENYETSQKAVRLAETYGPVYGAVGIHPHETKYASEEILQKIGDLAQLPKVKAIGEIGLDYHFFYSDKETQQKWFARQIELARDLDLPFLIHDREAHGDTLSILKKHKNSRMRGIMHCFSGSVETAEELMKLGFYISFAGPLVFPNSRRLKEAAREIPLDRLLIETDSPYLTPPPHRGERNEPVNVIYVAEEIARLKGISVETVVEETRKNGLSIYGIK
ncbi:TatD family hydrolase [uncultured Dialister sp.]|jgi:TatD DNase family protein|uniref:TatD family hydrolase n=1 Tax=uncultured Dialister sp. TaxID=278064 RepID=UPI0025E85BD0|nr:TatD family hydrolase [uncultured Dialister sp.]